MRAALPDDIGRPNNSFGGLHGLLGGVTFEGVTELLATSHLPIELLYLATQVFV